MWLLKVLLVGLLAPTLRPDKRPIEPHFDKATGKLVGGENLLKGRILAYCFLRRGMPEKEWRPLLSKSPQGAWHYALHHMSTHYPSYCFEVKTDGENRLESVRLETPRDPARETEVAFEADRH